MENLTEKYIDLYKFMATSNNPENMRLFGEVASEMMNWLIKNQPSQAEIYIDKLCAMKWQQYLTKNEAAAVLSKMEPAAKWSFETWKNAMERYSLEAERQAVFNAYALWVEMNSKYSDYAEALATKAFGKPIAEIPEQNVFALIHALAVCSLTDKDGVYNIRSYFSL